MDQTVLSQIRTKSDWSMVFRDVAVWRPLVLAVLRRQGLAGGIAHQDVEPGSIAGTHAVFTVGRRLVVKFYAPFWRSDYDREVAVLERLRSRPALGGDITLPRLLASGTIGRQSPGSGGKDWPYIVTTFLAGVPLGEVWTSVDAGTRLELAKSLGRALAELHATDLDGLDVLSPGDRPPADRSDRARDWRLAEWLEFVAAQSASAQSRHRQWQSLPEHLLADIPGFLSRLGPLPRPGWRPSLLSGDITADHVLLAQAEGRWRIVGLIDFGDATAGDPEYEFVVAYLSALDLDRRALDALLAAYGHQDAGDGLLDRRLMAYMLLHQFPLPAALPPALRARVSTAPDLDEATLVLWGRP